MTPGRLALVVVASLLSVGVLGFLATRMMPSAPPVLVSQEPAAQAPAPTPVAEPPAPTVEATVVGPGRRPHLGRRHRHQGGHSGTRRPRLRHRPAQGAAGLRGRVDHPRRDRLGRVAARHPRRAHARRTTAGPARRSSDPALDGDPYAAIRATPETSAWHGDPVWDHAVGPLQFIPSTWEQWGTDADGDGVADPNDIDDAAGAAVAYLCADGHDLTSGAGWADAVFGYNHDQSLRRLGLRRGHGLCLADRVGIS